MLLKVVHNHENFKANAPFCARCPDLDTANGLCKQGIYHSEHAKADFCPAGKFGQNKKPATWPHAEEARLNVCRSCRAKAGHVCGIDQAGIRNHASEAVCPIGRYVDGVTGNLPTPEATTGQQPASDGKGCCGG